MSREDESLPPETLQDAERLERGIDHNGKAVWYLSTREGWQETGDKDGVINMDPTHFPQGAVIQLSVPEPVHD